MAPRGGKSSAFHYGSGGKGGHVVFCRHPRAAMGSYSEVSSMKTLAQFAQLYMELGDQTAFIYRRGPEALRRSYGQVAELAFRFVRELESRGLSKGDRVMLWGDNSAEWVAAFLACMLRSPLAVPMDKIAAPDFAQRVAEDVNAKLLVCSAALAEHHGGRSYIELERLSEALAHF